jgi:hypothetical protein
MADRFDKFFVNANDPADHAYAITPDATTDLANFTRAIYVGSGGNLTVTMVTETSNTFVTFVGVPTGSVLPIRVKRVSTASTANSIVGIY